MEVWEDKLNDMLDQVLLYASDWDELLDMLAAADNKGERPLLFKYMEYLIARVQLMDRKFNRVKVRALKDNTKVWSIENYSFAMYKYILAHYKDDAIFTKWAIHVPDTVLSEQDRDKLRAEL